MKFTRAEMIERAAKRSPWDRDVADSILAAIASAGEALSLLGERVRELTGDDDFDDSGAAKRYKRRYLKNVGEAMSETFDLTDAIYSKFPDLAPEDQKRFYTA